RDAHHLRKIWILAKRFPETWPEWIATEIENRRETPWNAGGTCFNRGDLSGTLHQLGIERRGHSDLLWKESRALHVISAVNRVDAINHRNAEPRFLSRGFLNLTDDLMPVIDSERLIRDVENRSDAVFDDRVFEFCGINFDLLILSGSDRADGELRHLPDFFFERHALDQVIDLSRVVAFRSGATRALEEFITIDWRRLGFKHDQGLGNEAQ